MQVPGLKVLGYGELAHERGAPAEIRQRNSAIYGTATLHWGWAGVTAWGNRIFVRSNDYLWCIGDAAQPYVPAQTAVHPSAP